MELLYLSLMCICAGGVGWAIRGLRDYEKVRITMGQVFDLVHPEGTVLCTGMVTEVGMDRDGTTFSGTDLGTQMRRLQA